MLSFLIPKLMGLKEENKKKKKVKRWEKREDKKKAMHLKDVIMAKHLIKEGSEFQEDYEEALGEKKKNMTYSEEQEEIRKAFMDAVKEAEEEEDVFLKEKKKGDDVDDDDSDDFTKRLNEYFSRDDDPWFGLDREEDDVEIEKPDFDKEDELLGLPKGWNAIESGDGYKGARERSVKHQLKNGDDNDDCEGESEEGGKDDGDERESEKRGAMGGLLGE